MSRIVILQLVVKSSIQSLIYNYNYDIMKILNLIFKMYKKYFEEQPTYSIISLFFLISPSILYFISLESEKDFSFIVNIFWSPLQSLVELFSWLNFLLLTLPISFWFVWVLIILWLLIFLWMINVQTKRKRELEEVLETWWKSAYNRMLKEHSNWWWYLEILLFALIWIKSLIVLVLLLYITVASVIFALSIFFLYITLFILLSWFIWSVQTVLLLTISSFFLFPVLMNLVKLVFTNFLIIYLPIFTTLVSLAFWTKMNKEEEQEEDNEEAIKAESIAQYKRAAENCVLSIKENFWDIISKAAERINSNIEANKDWLTNTWYSKKLHWTLWHVTEVYKQLPYCWRDVITIDWDNHFKIPIHIQNTSNVTFSTIKKLNLEDMWIAYDEKKNWYVDFSIDTVKNIIYIEVLREKIVEKIPDIVSFEYDV